MAAPKNGVVLSDKRVYDQAGVLPPNSDRLTHERLKSRENCLDKAARDPHDRSPVKEVVVPEDSTETESPSLAIDLDGLSRPSMFLSSLPLSRRTFATWPQYLVDITTNI